MRRSLDNPGGRFLGLLLSLIALACAGEGPRDRGDPGSPERAGLFLQSSSPVQTPETNDEITRSRSTAIVEAASRVSPAVVSIHTARRQTIRRYWQRFSRRATGLGSGFVISGDGYVLTNDHVVRGAEEIQVTLPDGRAFNAERVGEDQLNDIAVLKIDGAELPVAPLGRSGDLLIGEWAIAIGNPLGNLFSNTEPSVTAGVISAVDRHLIPDEDDQVVYLGMIQTDASINPGNSGGPLVNAAGEVIGVNSSILSQSGGSEGLGFAIPIDRALRLAEDLIHEGVVRRAWLGFDVEPTTRDSFGRSSGVMVRGIDPTSAAADLLENGDRILTAGGRRMADPYDFETVLLGLRPGDRIELEVAGRDEPLTLRAVDLPSMTAERAAVGDLELLTVNPGVQREFDLGRSQGALITQISAALQRVTRLREGDLLLQINRTVVTSADQALRLIRRLSGTRGVVVVYFERDGEIRYTDFRL